jgi:hypothetical protein
MPGKEIKLSFSSSEEEENYYKICPYCDSANITFKLSYFTCNSCFLRLYYMWLSKIEPRVLEQILFRVNDDRYDFRHNTLLYEKIITNNWSISSSSLCFKPFEINELFKNGLTTFNHIVNVIEIIRNF